jgi:ankyrin repeat protein
MTAPTLFDAITAGDLERVKALISAEPRLVDAKSDAGSSAILTAVYHGRKDIANLLVARGATLTLFEAAAAGEVERAERLLDADASAIHAYSADGWTPLHLAAFFGHHRLAELLLDRGADPRAVSHNANANTPLHASLAGGHVLTAGLLLGRGADVNAADGEGWRPLHIAAAGQAPLDLLKALIAQGADVRATNGAGHTARDVAVRQNRAEAAAFLKRHEG